jgi:hypothetical protein
LSDPEGVAQDVRQLKRYQVTLKKWAKAYTEIAEHLLTLQEINPDINILTSGSNENSSNENSNTESSGTFRVSRKKKIPSNSEESP